MAVSDRVYTGRSRMAPHGPHNIVPRPHVKEPPGGLCLATDSRPGQHSQYRGRRWSGAVLPSPFEEQIEQGAGTLEQYTRAGPASFAEASSYLPPTAGYRVGPHEYLETIRKAHDAVGIPVIASLNGVTGATWTDHARLAQGAGASAIELNVFFIPADPSLIGQEVEQRYVDVLRAVKSAVSIPVSMKLSPYFSALAHTVRVLGMAGADGFVLFNRFISPTLILLR